MTLRIVAQKVNADGRTYLLREIYGIEHKRGAEPSATDGDEEDEEDDDTECVVSLDRGRATCQNECFSGARLASFPFPHTRPEGLHV